MIKFKLKHIDEVQPVGIDGNLRMSWFWLTDGDLWLTIGDYTLYEYTPEAIEYFGNRQSPYCEYPLVRFIEDFTGLFKEISESIPKEIYHQTDNLKGFLNEAKKWLDIYDTDEDEFNDFYFDEYDNLISWTYKRTFDSGHLIGGPHFSFFRCEDKIRIVWETEHQLKNGIELWTAKDGNIEISFSEFINLVKDFGKRFFEQMNKQLELALAKDWGGIQIDTKRLVEEHTEREKEFYHQITLLEQKPQTNTNWGLVNELIGRMQKEIKL